jgi:ABC-type multidrug transport system fused ATPase/permease subunit
MVLSAGEIIELDTPQNLVKKKGAFWKMVQETGGAEELIKIMN